MWLLTLCLCLSQCFTHRYLGWKINVLDSCDRGQQGAASEPVPSQVAAPIPSAASTVSSAVADQDGPGDLDGKPSIRVETRVPGLHNNKNLKGLQGLISDEDEALFKKGIEKFAAAHLKEEAGGKDRTPQVRDNGDEVYDDDDDDGVEDGPAGEGEGVSLV